jgi:hypothetical protein
MAGFDAETVQPAEGGVIARAGVATLYGGSRVFAKTLPDRLHPPTASSLRTSSRLRTSLRWRPEA